MNKILTPITDRNGKQTRVWKKPEAGLTQSRLDKMMSGVPTQPVAFGKYDIANAKQDVMTRYFDEALMKDRIDDFGVDFASHPQLPAIYQTLLLHNNKTPEVANALIENPNVSVSSVAWIYEEAKSEQSFLSAVVHPLLPLDIAEDEYEYLEELRDTKPEWASRVKLQLERVDTHIAERAAKGN